MNYGVNLKAFLKDLPRAKMTGHQKFLAVATLQSRGKAQVEVATNLHQVFVARLWSPGAVLSEDLWMDIELHGHELDDAHRGKVHFRKRTMQQAEEEQIERKAEAVGCTAAGPHLSHILRGEEEKPGEVLR